ncbi:hypothetical protein AAHA92_31950 [Salvia divinorum]|uniref:Uncharacterized protein n=1 Tax=Salvia divinorum TaxID=28513 RepID=A0ABD1FL30_SALDI
MLGAGVQFNRSGNGDDRFSTAAKARRSNNLTRRAQSQSDVSSKQSRRDELPTAESSSVCNLERFLESIAPSVEAQYLSKMTVRDWRMCNVEFQPYFLLSDLWVAFKEWSAYGAGVPLLLNDRDSVIQYYVPYLSGIQLYGNLSMSTAKLRRLGEESDGESFRDSSSDGSSDREGFSSDEGESGSSEGSLLFEYLARDQPYCREPLADKISDLARDFPELTTLRSCDLLPSSWLSVAWYPIYRIPTGPTLKDLDACFLTFHSLHTPMIGNEAVHPPVVTHPSESDGVSQISLPAFGLASYKYKVSLWTPNAGNQPELANSLMQAADDWLNLLRVHHPDFSFFCRR